MLSNAYFLAKFRFDTAENEPAKNLQIFEKCIFEKRIFEKGDAREGRPKLVSKTHHRGWASAAASSLRNWQHEIGLNFEEDERRIHRKKTNPNSAALTVR